jgi:hypothetical protein
MGLAFVFFDTGLVIAKAASAGLAAIGRSGVR